VAHVAIVVVTLSLNQNITSSLSMTPDEVASLLSSSIQTTKSSSFTSFSETFAYCTGNAYASSLILGGVSGSYYEVPINSVNATSNISTTTDTTETSSAPTPPVIFIVTVIAVFSGLLLILAMKKPPPYVLIVYDGGPELGSVYNSIRSWISGNFPAARMLSSVDFSVEHPHYLSARFIIFFLGPPPPQLSQYFDTTLDVPLPQSIHSISGDAIYSGLSDYDSFLLFGSLLLSKLRTGFTSKRHAAKKFFSIIAAIENLDREDFWLTQNETCVSNAIKGEYLSRGGDELLPTNIVKLCELIENPGLLVDWLKQSVLPLVAFAEIYPKSNSGGDPPVQLTG